MAPYNLIEAIHFPAYSSHFYWGFLVRNHPVFGCGFLLWEGHMTFINWDGTIGIILGNATTTTHGSLFLTFLLIIVFFLAMALMFGIRLVCCLIFVLPLCLGIASFYSDFLALLLSMLVYLSFILTKNFIFK